MNATLFTEIQTGLRTGEIVPYLGPGVLADVHDENGVPMPVQAEPMILAMNNGRPMSPRLMVEFSRAAMQVEQHRGRAAVDRFLKQTYGERRWTQAAVHRWLGAMQPDYVIDTNRDTQLLDSYANRPHLLVVGVARLMGGAFRYRIFSTDGGDYQAVDADTADWNRPVLFKPLGTPRPTPQFIASDADFVDYLTELMGGFAIPAPLKARRIGKRYLLLGVRFLRDTERMLFSEISYGKSGGWAFIAEPTDKERRFCERQGLELVEDDGRALYAPQEAAMAS